MKPGERPPKGLKKLVLGLAGRDPRPTNRAIRESVEEKFGVGVDDRTIRRYCEAAGLPTSSREKPPGSNSVKGGQPQPASGQAGDDPDPELGPHRRGLFYFGKLLRELWRLPSPDDVIGPTVDVEKYGMWGPVPKSFQGGQCVPQTAEEEAVATDWGFLGYDARQRPLFKSFKQHLSDCDCLKTLGQAEGRFRRYKKAGKDAYQAVLRAVTMRVPRIADKDAEAMAVSLLWDSFRSKCGLVGWDFSYEPRKVDDSGAERWQLMFGAWTTRLVQDPAKLKPLAAAHQSLRAAQPFRAQVDTLAAAYKKALKSIQKFTDGLTPDDRLRKLILNGCCDLCP